MRHPPKGKTQAPARTPSLPSAPRRRDAQLRYIRNEKGLIPGGQHMPLMTWSRRLIAAFWTSFIWILFLGGPWNLPLSLSIQEDIEAAKNSQFMTVIILAASATIIALCAVILRKMASYIDRQVKALAFSDPLTGLPNRTLFLHRLEVTEAERKAGTRSAVFFIDIDRFKVINDSLGHAVGDEALIEVARRFESCLLPGDMLARFGGDEFVILRERVENAPEAAQLAHDLIESLSSPLEIGQRELFVTASIGIAISHPGLLHPSDLLRDADLALYRAKAAGRANFTFYSEEMNASVFEQFSLDTDLWRANERGELKLVYQPEFSVETGELLGFEALLRWNHPSRGVLLPSNFIGLAEENGSLMEIGLWAIEAACSQLRTWRLANPNRPNLEMSINLSARQLQQIDFVDHVDEILKRTPIEPHFVRLEITESVLVQDNTTALDALSALKRIGVKLAIDDFGTGYSSLSSLRNLPVDALKIDQSFVNGLNKDESNSFIIQGIVTMAHDLGLSVTAEGIETEEQLAYLRRLGCDRGQGFHLARPLSSEVVDALISDRRLRTVHTPEEAKAVA